MTTRFVSLGKLPSCYSGAEIFCPNVDELDVTSDSMVQKYFDEHRPNLVFHCASFTNVDGCEDDVDKAMAVNAEGTRRIAQACERVGAKLVYISTDYVFSGDKDTSYVESDRCNPLNVYGLSKLQGELYTSELCSRSFIVRTSWLYGFHGNSFVKTILKKSRDIGHLLVVDDQRGNPTNVEDLAYHTLQLAITDNYGIYHCSGEGICSWYEFASKIIKLANVPCELIPCTSEEYRQKAKRPSFSALENDMLRRTIGNKMRNWEEALEDYITKLEGEK